MCEQTNPQNLGEQQEAEYRQGNKALGDGAKQRLPQAYAVLGYLIHHCVIPVPDETVAGKAHFDAMLYTIAEILSLLDWTS